MSQSSLLEGLNKPQKEAVLHEKGPLLILAGAGSGKTRVMTHRIANLVKYHGVRPSHVLAVTFTNKAANEMKERIAVLLKNPMKRTVLPYLGTFHAVCAKILRQEAAHIGIPKTFSIFDEEDQISLIKELEKKHNFTPEELPPRMVISIISRAKDDLVSPADYAALADSPLGEKIATLYPEYEKELRGRGALDFGDLLSKTVTLFRESPKVLTRYQEKFEHILVDEYQDTNHAQYIIIKKLAEKHRNIAVCGDDDQSIYAWRGATVKNILSFEQDYPDAKVIKLEQNYRSTRTILDAAYYVIKNNISRKDKRIWTDNKKGDIIISHSAETSEDEAYYVAQQIHELKEQGLSPQEIAVLYRTNAQSRIIEEAMIREQIPYRIVGGFRFYQRKEIKDILAYLRVLVNPSDTSAVFRIINTPPRGIGSITISKLRKLSTLAKVSIGRILVKIAEVEDPASGGNGSKDKQLELEKTLFENPKLKKLSGLLSALREAVNEMIPEEAVKLVINKTKYMDYIQTDKKEAESRIENLEELVNAASRYKDAPGLDGIHKLLTDIALMEKEDDSEKNSANKITLMTLHSAKGLEFNTVIMVGMEEGLLPHSNSLDTASELEEERRLCYVGITRAKQRLYLVRAARRALYGKEFDMEPSRFLFEIPEKLVKIENPYSSYSSSSLGTSDNSYAYSKSMPAVEEAQTITVKPGDRVKHPQFGVGVVNQIDGDIIYVTFEKSDRKAFMAEYSHLEKL